MQTQSVSSVKPARPLVFQRQVNGWTAYQSLAATAAAANVTPGRVSRLDATRHCIATGFGVINPHLPSRYGPREHGPSVHFLHCGGVDIRTEGDVWMDRLHSLSSSAQTIEINLRGD